MKVKTATNTGQWNTTFILVILLAICSIRSYGSVVHFSTIDSTVRSGDVIKVAIVSTIITSDIRMDRISSTHGGTASNLWLSPDYWIVNQGLLVNSGNVLIEEIYTYETPVAPKVSGNLCMFDYLVPDVPYGTLVTIFANPENGAVNYVGFAGADNENLTPEPLILTVIPEPATLALLGAGGLCLRKRRR